MKSFSREDGKFAVEIEVEPHSMVTVIFVRQDGPITFSAGFDAYPPKDGRDFRFMYGGTARSIVLSATTEASDEQGNAPDTERGT